MQNIEKFFTRAYSFRLAASGLILTLLNACGGGGGETVAVNTDQGATISASTGGIVASATDKRPLAVFSSGVVTSNTSVTAIASSAVISALDVGAVAASQQVTLNIDPATISESTQEASVTIYLPALPSATASAKSELTTSNKLSLPGSELIQVVRLKLGADFLYGKMVLTDTALGVRSDAVAAVTISKELLVRAGGKIEAIAMDVTQTVKTAVATTPDGELFELTSDTTSRNVSVPAPGAPLVLPSGKLPLVVVHGIQALCVSESAAYQTTWKSFAQFFYSNAELQSKFKLYSFAYRTDSGIASNGEKLRQQLLTVFGTTKVVVLAHSMGGLVARYADASSAEGLKGLLTLNTPHHGTTNNIAGLSVGVNGLSKALMNNPLVTIPAYLLAKDGLSSQCFSGLNTQGAIDLRWDYFDAVNSANRCTGTSGNDFLCATGTGLNRRMVPAKMFVYSSFRAGNAEFIQKASGWILQQNLIETMLLDDGDVPVASQQFQGYDESKSSVVDRYFWRLDIKNAEKYVDLDHVQIHDDPRVFTSGGITNTGLSGDLIELAKVSVLPHPDLIPSAVTTTPASVQPGASVNVSWRITNSGNANAAASTTGLRLVSAATSGNGTAANHLINVPTGALAVGGVANQSQAITIPAGTVPGSYVVVVAVDNVATSTLGQGNVANDYARSTPFTVAASLPTPVATGRLPDTGITANQCYGAGSNVLISCTSGAAIALSGQQDGMLGRDVTNNDNTDGKAGFSYSLVPDPSGAAGPNFAKTSCVKDNSTGLIWEGKPADGGLRDFNRTYTNYGDGRVGDASAYVAAVNTAGLCGATDWRLPTADELQGLVDYGVAYPGPTIDATWFPNTQGNWFWSSPPYVGFANYAWVVNFIDGGVNDIGRGSTDHARLVRAGQ